MKYVLIVIVAFFFLSCKSNLDEKKSKDAFNKGTLSLENFSEKEEPNREEANKYFVEAAELDPKNITAHYWKADIDLNLGKFEEAHRTAVTTVSSISAGHELRPNLLMIAGLSAKKQDKSGDTYFKEANDIYERRIKDNSKSIDAILNKAIVLCYMNKKDDAVKFLNTLSYDAENQALVEKIKLDIQNFEAEKVISQLAMNK